MKLKEYQQFKMDCYKAFIEAKYGEKALSDLEIAIKPRKLEKILEIRDDQQFIESMENIRNKKDDE